MKNKLEADRGSAFKAAREFVDACIEEGVHVYVSENRARQHVCVEVTRRGCTSTTRKFSYGSPHYSSKVRPLLESEFLRTVASENYTPHDTYYQRLLDMATKLEMEER